MARSGRGPGGIPGGAAPVPDAPALRLDAGAGEGPTLVVADLHLGLGGTVERPGGPPGGSAEELVERLADLLRRSGSRRLLIAGDIKHPIVGVPRALRPLLFDFFARILSEGAEVDVVLGNHDVGLAAHLPSEVTVHPAGGMIVAGTGVFHGHRWPTDPVLSCRRLVAGHLHPGFRLAPTPEYPLGKRPCWVRVERDPPEVPPRRRRRHAPIAAREILVIPAFHPLAGIEALNRERPARGRSFLVGRFLSTGAARAYLLDGTDLGPILTRRTPRGRGPGGVRSPRDR